MLKVTELGRGKKASSQNPHLPELKSVFLSDYIIKKVK